MNAIREKERAKKIIVCYIILFTIYMPIFTILLMRHSLYSYKYKTYNFYIDCLSTESSQPIPEEMLKKIKEYLYRNKAISSNISNRKLINELEKEVIMDFERSNNKTIFDSGVYY